MKLDMEYYAKSYALGQQLFLLCYDQGKGLTRSYSDQENEEVKPILA